MQNVYGAKNLVPFPYNDTTKAEDGLTFTDNGDGSVTINGTSSRASGYTYFVFSERQDGDLILPIGDYTYSMEIVSGSITSGEVKALVEKYNGVPGTSDGWAVVETLTNASVSSNFSLSAERNMAVLIRIKFGASLSNLRIRPMIRLACIKDDTYVMYAKTNKEITDELGSTDISSIGNGTVTGGISSLNSALSNIHREYYSRTYSNTSLSWGNVLANFYTYIKDFDEYILQASRLRIDSAIYSLVKYSPTEIVYSRDINALSSNRVQVVSVIFNNNNTGVYLIGYLNTSGSITVTDISSTAIGEQRILRLLI